MVCPKCGAKVNSKQKFCTECGCELPPNQNIKIFIVSFISLLFFVIFAGIIFLFSDDLIYGENLYKAYPDNDYAFINVRGQEVLRISRDDYDAVGDFREDRIFTAKIKDENIAQVVTLYMLDRHGNIIKQFDNVYSDFYYEDTDANSLPEFYHNFALIQIIDEKDISKIGKVDFEKLNIKDVYIDKNGNIVEKVPEKIRLMLQNPRLTIDRFKKHNDLIYKEAPCENNKDETCYGYTDKKGKIIVKPIYDTTYLACHDWYGRNPEFYDGIAEVFIRSEDEPKVGNHTILDGGYRFINKKGEYINNESYDYAQPFYGKLAFIEKGDLQGFINRKGKWVWSYAKWKNPNLVMYQETDEDEEEKEKISVEINNTVKSLEEKENWEKVAEHIYFNPNSIEDIEWLNKKWRQGEFKFYKGADDMDTVLEFDFENMENAIYAIYKVAIAYDDDNMGFKSWVYYDANDNHVSDFSARICSSDKYTDYEHGQFYYNILFNNN